MQRRTFLGLNGSNPAPFQLPRILFFENAFSRALINASNHSALCNVATLAEIMGDSACDRYSLSGLKIPISSG